MAKAVLVSLAVIMASTSAGAQHQIRSFSGLIEGHEVGGIAIDMIGNIYSADFGDVVWKITPEGARHQFASGMYGTSGNAIDNHGNLLQASFYADTVTKIDRNGKAELFVSKGLNRPTGIAVNRQTGDVFVANCRSNAVVKIMPDGTTAPFAYSKLLDCPYGLTFDRNGNLYTVNFNNNAMLRIDPTGAVSQFATISEKGLGYLCFKSDKFYVTAFRSHEIYEVDLDGSVRKILGTGERGMVDGTKSEARLSFPAGIACHPWAPRIYVNEDVNESGVVLPRRSAIRIIDVAGDR